MIVDQTFNWTSFVENLNSCFCCIILILLRSMDIDWEPKTILYGTLQHDVKICKNDDNLPRACANKI